MDPFVRDPRARHLDTETLRQMNSEKEMVGIAIDDAAELSEVCRYAIDWIKGAPPEVKASLRRFGASAFAPSVLIEALNRFSDLLLRAVPSTSPTPVMPGCLSTPLGAGEAIGLAEILLDLAIDGWPADPGHAEALSHDCRRWAVRLMHIPGVITEPAEPSR
jgi:hypothetical protein